MDYIWFPGVTSDTYVTHTYGHIRFLLNSWAFTHALNEGIQYIQIHYQKMGLCIWGGGAHFMYVMHAKCTGHFALHICLKAGLC